MKKLIIAFIVSCHATVCLAVVTTQLEQSQIAAGDNFRVSFIINNNATNIVPNFTPLQKNFEIIGTSKSTQLSVINGHRNLSTIWELTLLPKAIGELTIPAITFGNDQSNPLKLQVTHTATPTTAAKTKVFLEASVDNHHPYVQSQIIYKVKLFYSQPLSSGAISAPKAAQAVIIPISKSYSSEQQREGIVYQVLEQDYAIFPQQRGQLSIEPPVFNGSVTDARGKDFDQLLLAVQRPLQARAPRLTLDVAAMPAAFTAKQWLPARDLKLSESWHGLEQTPSVGQPLTREIIIRAQGLTAAQLPELSPSIIAGVNSYPDKAKLHNSDYQGNLVGERQITITYIPTQTGLIQLPAITLPWWNTLTHQLETATLPAHSITIFPANTKISATHKIAALPQSTRWPWITTLSMLALWVITLLLWRCSLKKQKLYISKKTLLQQFEQACRTNQCQLAQQVLLNLAQTIWPDQRFTHLMSIANYYNDVKFTDALKQLDIASYAGTTQPWNGTELWLAWKNISKKPPKHPQAKQELPSLYL